MAVATNVKQSKNVLKISGILVENSLKSGTYKNAEGKDVEYIAGALVTRVNQSISGKEEMSDIPVNIWVPRFTTAGKPNPAYESAAKAMNTYTSLAVSDNESTATKILITNGTLTENIYSIDGDKVFCTPKFTTSFVNSVSNISNYNPEATFTVDAVVGQIDDEVDKEGVPTGRLKIKGMVGRYNGTMDTFDFYAENPNAITYIRSYWKVGDTVEISGKIRYNVKAEKIEIPTRFGEPQFKTRTTVCRELVITADCSDALTDEQKFTEQEIKDGLAKRAELIEAAKAKAKKTGAKSAQTTTSASANPYGF